jgi:hypothetical protein
VGNFIDGGAKNNLLSYRKVILAVANLNASCLIYDSVNFLANNIFDMAGLK